MVELTKAEAESLMNHLEVYVIQEIRDDDEYDNLSYLLNLIHVYEKCKREVDDGEEEKEENQPAK